MQPLPLLLPALLAAGAAGAGLAYRPGVAPAPTPTSDEAPVVYNVDPVHSFVTFRVGHLGIGQAYGSFGKVEGVVHHDAEDPSASKVRIVIDATTVDTNNANRDKHLLSSDFLSAKEFPEIVFESKSVTVAEDGAMELTGELTLHGVTRETTAQVRKIGEGEDPWGNQRIGFEAMLKVDRMAHGVDYMPDGLGTEVEVWLAVEGIREKAE
jgi:polyisoprenoid-binding protein YceI